MITALLREPSSILEQCHVRECQPRIVQLSLALIASGCAIFGAAVGSYTGAAQIASSALKVPLATLVTLAAAGPAFAALAAAFERPWGVRTTLAIALAAGARLALVLGAFSPLLWLIIDLGAPYYATKLLATAAYGLAGLSALALLLRGLGPGAGRIGAAAGFIAVYGIVGAQAAWLLRPYIGDPGDEEIPAFAYDRKEGGVAKAIMQALGR